MSHKFVIKIDGQLHTFTKYEDIPQRFDHVIEFSPQVPEPPHTHEQHEEIEQWQEKLKKLMEIENARSN